jgi:high frequency lysogenization protein
MALKNFSNQVLALAGVFQACDQIKKIAWHGQCEADVLDTAVESVFKIDAASFDDIYGGCCNIQHGLRILARETDPQTGRPDNELVRYLISLLSIERKLTRQHAVGETIRKAINEANTQLQHFGKQHPNTLAALADIYQRTISQLTPRIMVSGEQIHLTNENNAAKIRTLLLAALRSIVLWRQCGGNRISFLLQRRKYFHESNSLLASS